MRANDPWSEMLSHYDRATLLRLQADARFWGAGDVLRAVEAELARRDAVNAVPTPAAGISRRYIGAVSYIERVMQRAAQIVASDESVTVSDAIRAARSEVAL